MHRAAVAPCLLLALAGCASRTAAPGAVVEAPPPPTGWRAIATIEDQERLAELPGVWERARAAAPRRLRARLADEAELLQPDAADPLPTPPPGPYRCRLVRLGGKAGFATFSPDFCYVDGGTEGLTFTKQTGENLPGGWLYPDGDTRLVFLGATPQPGGKDGARYGDDPARDVAGVVERVSPFRWRLVLARAGRGALLDVYELVPVTPQVPGATPAVPARDG